jgi:hypothetical protein
MMELQVRSLRGIRIDCVQEPLVVVVVAGDEVKLAVWILPHQLIEPINRGPDCRFDRPQRGPAKVKNVATQHKSARPACGCVQGTRMLWGLGPARKQVQVGHKVRVRFHSVDHSKQRTGVPMGNFAVGQVCNLPAISAE